jgi:hypothetical protein
MHKIKIFLVLFIPSLIIMFWVPACSAARLYLEADGTEANQGDSMIAKIKLDNQGECLNAFDVTLSFSENLEFKDFSSGDSIINLWIVRPAQKDAVKINQQRSLNFSGGIPGGYCGSIMGDQGESNILGEAVFKVVAAASSTAQVNIMPGAQVLKNDGLGTAAKLETANLNLNITALPAKNADQWQNRLGEDRNPPEPFVIELFRDARLYEGRYVLIFSAQDKETGIDRYEVKELSSEDKQAEKHQSFLRKISIWKKSPVWLAAQSPYLLKDQSLNSYVQVKAVDKAGNERMVEYFPPESERAKVKKVYTVPIFMLLLLLAGLLIIIIVIRKIKKRKS